MTHNDQGDFTRDPLIRAFAALLRSLREDHGLSRPRLAEALGFGYKWIEKLERCECPPSEETADALDTYFKTAGRAFWVLWREIKREGKHVKLPPGFAGYVEREREASEIWIFDIAVINGLFQTPDYAREVLKSGRRPEQVEQLVNTRIERQAILTRKDPPNVAAVFDEGAIRRLVGDSAVMKAQMAHLIELAQEPLITLQIVPLSTGSYAGLPGAFHLLRFPNGPDVAYVEGHAEDRLIEHPDMVRRHALRFSLIRGAAMSADESLSLLQCILESL